MKKWESFNDDELWAMLENCPWIHESTHDLIMGEWLTYKQSFTVVSLPVPSCERDIFLLGEDNG